MCALCFDYRLLPDEAWGLTPRAAGALLEHAERRRLTDQLDALTSARASDPAAVRDALLDQLQVLNGRRGGPKGASFEDGLARLAEASGRPDVAARARREAQVRRILKLVSEESRA